MVSFREVTEKQWEAIPPPTGPKAPSQWDEVLGAVETGKIVQLEVPEEKIKGTRIGLARIASVRGMKLEFRVKGTEMLVRKSENPPTPKKPKSY